MLIPYTAILTCYNSEATVVRALNSISSQNLTPSEIIVVDDNSTDDTVRIIENWNEARPNLKLMKQLENRGQSYARNLAVEISNSELCIFFDDDDFSHPHRAEEHVEMFLRGVDISFVSSKKIYTDSLSIESICTPVDVTLEAQSTAQRLLLGRQIPGQVIWSPASTCAVRRSWFLSLGGYDSTYRRLEDSELLLRASMGQAKAAWSSKLLVERFLTNAPDKTRRIDLKYELRLMKTYGKLLSKNDLEILKHKSQIRMFYFDPNFSNLIRALHSSIHFLAKKQMWLKLFNRVKKDILQLRSRLRY